VACGKSSLTGGDPHAPSVQVSVVLKNLTTPVLGDPVHLFGPNEEMSPSNRVEPAGSRTQVVTMRRDEQAVFYAGRNGSVLAQKTCKCTSACPAQSGDGGPTVTGPSVEWSGSTLSCHGW
jgi:hypothetical protein